MRVRGTAALVLAALAAVPAFAQDAEAPSNDPAKLKEKVIEVERLMRQAEESLARSASGTAARDAEDAVEKLLDSKSRAQTGKSAAELRSAAEGGSAEASETLRKLLEESRREAGSAGDAVRKLLDEKAQKQTGKSAEELRRLAESGARDAQEQLRRLTEEAQREAASAADGVRKVLEETQKSGQGAAQGIEWLLRAAQRGGTKSGNDPSSGGHPQGDDPESRDPKKKPEKDKPDEGDQPKSPKEGDQEKKGDEPPPPGGREKPRDAAFDAWFAELPPQVRKAYETRDWDSIPLRWRDLLRDWTKKLADDLERSRR